MKKTRVDSQVYLTLKLKTQKSCILFEWMISEVQLIRICGLGPSLSNVPTETQISLVVGVVLCQSLLTIFQEVENVYFWFCCNDNANFLLRTEMSRLQ